MNTVLITQPMINAFAEITGDNQWIHIDPVRASASTLGSAVAHGMLVASLVPVLLSDAVDSEDSVAEFLSSRPDTEIINRGFSRLDFAAPVPVGSVLSLESRVLAARPARTALDVDVDFLVWCEQSAGAKKLAAGGVLRLRYRGVG